MLENWPESYQPVNCLTFSLQLFFGPRNRRGGSSSSSSSRRKDKKQKAQKEVKRRVGNREGMQICQAEFRWVETEEKPNDSGVAEGPGRVRAGQGDGKGESGPMGTVIKCLQFYFSSFALSKFK